MNCQCHYCYCPRQSGKTTHQMLKAPIGAIFVWCNYKVDYAKRLAEHLGRTDLMIVTPSALSTGQLYGINNKALIIDHAADLTEPQRAGYKEYMIRYESRKKPTIEIFISDEMSKRIKGAMNMLHEKRQIRGKFWMVQQDVLAGESQRDRFGHDTVDWPGKSVFETKKAALEAANALAKKNPGRGYFVMEAVTMTSTSDPVTNTVKL